MTHTTSSRPPGSRKAEKLYVAMVGLPAMGKSVIAYKLQENLRKLNLEARVFNNGEIRRRLFPQNTSHAQFYDPDNQELAALRDDIALMNMYAAKNYLLRHGGQIAILDATNVSPARRRKLAAHLSDHPILYVECRNEDPDLYAASIARKARLSEFSHLTPEEARLSFEDRIDHYRLIYKPLDQGEEAAVRDYVVLDSLSNRILVEHIRQDPPFYAVIRDLLVSDWVKGLCLVRHGETEHNAQNRIGGDSELTAKGRRQARQLAAHFRDKHIACVVTSTRKRTRQMADMLLEGRPEVERYTLSEFDEIDAGLCEGLAYEDVRRRFPEVDRARRQDKYHAAYPQGESYATLKARVEKGVRKALYLSGNATSLVIIGHQAVNRMILADFLFRREEDLPYAFIPQDRYFHIVSTQSRKLVELLEF